MRCKKVKDLLLDYADLHEGQKKSVDEHLRGCPECLNEFESYRTALGLLQNNLDFNPSENYWGKFGLERKSYPSFFDLKSYFLDKMEYLLSLLRTPLLGPIPAYVFSFLILIFVSFSFSSVLRTTGYKPSKLVSNLIINEAQLLSAKDDGLLTIYTISQK
jgi:hypothetical protein